MYNVIWCIQSHSYDIEWIQKRRWIRWNQISSFQVLIQCTGSWKMWAHTNRKWLSDGHAHFSFSPATRITIQCIFNISHQLSGAVRHPPGHDLYSVCILIDDKLYNDTWNCSAFHKLFRTKFRFNIDEWICDLLHKKCSASIRKMVLHYIVCSVIISLGMK